MSNELKNTHEIEKQLETYYQKGAPSSQFVDTLESRLVQAHQGSSAKQSRTRKPLFLRPAFAPAFVVALALLVVVVIGPREVLAQVQALLGYVPGYGFVEVDDIRVLPSTVSQTQDGVTMTIKQVLIKEENTYIIVGVEGLPPEDEILADIQAFYLEHQPELGEVNDDLWNTQTFVTLEDGTVFSDPYFSGAPWAGYFILPPFPKGALNFSLDVDRIPGVLPEKSPRDWHFDLSVEYLRDPRTAPGIEDYAGGQFQLNPNLLTPVPVDQASQPDPSYGFTLELVEMVYAEGEVALRVKYDNLPEGWISMGTYLDGRLTDDLGNEYPIIYSPSSGLQPDGTTMLTFEPVSPEARSLTLTVVDLYFFAQMERQTITVDFGDSPQVGDRFPIDQTITVFGTPVHFSSVQLGQEETTDQQTSLNVFEFEIDPVPVQDGISINLMGLSDEVLAKLGTNFSTAGGGGSGIPEDPNFSTLNLSIGIPATLPLPTGNFDFIFDNANLLLKGPYTITWEIAGNQ
jgi:hypothetical protein